MGEIGTFRLSLPASMLRRGFWLYVWRVTAANGKVLLYVGRTGDNSSPNASPAYIRMGQHLGWSSAQNALRRHLSKERVVPERCRSFDFVAHGPVHPEVTKPSGFDYKDRVVRSLLMKRHVPLRDKVGAMEKRLAKELQEAGYTVLNDVKSAFEVSDAKWAPIRRAFAKDFPKLKRIA